MKWIRSVMLFVAGIVVGTVLTQSIAAQQNRPLGHRINHVGIRVTNFEESLKFYTQVMGFKEAYRFPSPDGKPSTTFLQINRDTFIEMAPPDGKQPAGPVICPGRRHIKMHKITQQTQGPEPGK